MTANEYELLPLNVKNILDTIDEDNCLYSECERITKELNAIDWDCDYDLSGEIFDVKRKKSDLHSRDRHEISSKIKCTRSKLKWWHVLLIVLSPLIILFIAHFFL